MRSLHHKLGLRFIYLSKVVLIPACLGSSILRIISWSPLVSKEVSLSGQICQRRYTLSVTHIRFNENKVIFYAKRIWKLWHSFNRGIYIILYMISCCFSKFHYYVVFFWILHSSIWLLILFFALWISIFLLFSFECSLPLENWYFWSSCIRF